MGEISLREEGEPINENDRQADGPMMGQPSADYSPGDNREGDGDVGMEGTTNKWDDRVDDAEVVEIDDERMNWIHFRSTMTDSQLTSRSRHSARMCS